MHGKLLLRISVVTLFIVDARAVSCKQIFAWAEFTWALEEIVEKIDKAEDLWKTDDTER